MRLILIRHGKTSANLNRQYYGFTDLPVLSEEMKLLKEERPDFPENTKDFRFITSGLLRTIMTKEAYFEDHPYETMECFKEGNVGEFEMKTYEELKDKPEYQKWISGDNEANIPPGGESMNQVSERVLAGLGQLISENKDTVLFAHGGPIYCIMKHLFKDEQRNFYEWIPDSGCGYIVDINSDGCCYSEIKRIKNSK